LQFCMLPSFEVEVMIESIVLLSVRPFAT
jgi:hypothetical protein